jgi:hypothetical protein
MTGDRAALLQRLAELEERERAPDVRLALAEAEFRLAVLPGADPGESVERLRRAIRHDPFSAKAYLHLGRLRHRAGRRWSALAAYRQAYRLVPGGRRVPLLIAAALLDLGRTEREIGGRLLAASVTGAEAEIAAAVAELDDLVSDPAGRPDGAPAGSEPARAAPRRRPPPGPAVIEAAPPDHWRLLLGDQVLRRTPAGPWTRTYLRAGLSRGGDERSVADVATAAVLLLTSGAPAADVRAALAEARPPLPPAHPAARMLTATLELVEAADPAVFVARAAALVEARIVPAEVAVALHFTRFGGSGPDVLEALRVLDAYPAAVSGLDAFRELRLAVLDEYARRAWHEERLDEAGVLWRATVALDPYRLEIAVNLALLAARTRAPIYRPAWERVAELLYLHAAGAGDLDERAGDRIALHRAQSRQSLQRSGSDDPDGEELDTWIDDGDAVEVWLRDWDLYYLNSRLRFRSATHLLGVDAEADADECAEARDVLLRHLGSAVGGQGWAGARAFHDLAAARVGRAWEQATGRPGADRHREREQAAADELLREALLRVGLLGRLSRRLGRRDSVRHRRLACSVIRHTFDLPLRSLTRSGARLGMLTTTEDLGVALDRSAAQAAARWGAEAPADRAEAEAMVADLGAVAGAVPDRAGLRVPYGRALFWAGRPGEAYAIAAQAVERRPEPESASLDLLADLIDDVADAAIEQAYRDRPDADRIAVARDVQARYPLAAVPRIRLAHLLGATGRAEQADEAAALLAAAVRGARSPWQRRRVLRELARSTRLAPAVRRHLDRLRRDALAGMRTGHGAAARTDLGHALAIARECRFADHVARLEADLARLRPKTGAS